MKKSIGVLLLGFLVGIAVGFGISTAVFSNLGPKASSDEKEFSKNLEKALQEINRRIQINYPGVSARVKNYTAAGEFYIVNIEFYDKNGTISVDKYYISKDGKLIVSANYANYMISLEKVHVSEDDDPWIGAKDAKVVIVEFSDYACPYCAKFALEVEKKIVENYKNTVKLVFRDFPVHGESSYKAAEAANCAREQGKFWEYHYLLFERQKEWYNNVSKFLDYAEELGLNSEKFRECLDSGKYRQEVEKDFMDGVSYGVQGTPTFFINDDMVIGYRSYEEFTRLIEERLK
ncbi:MAG: DsbA family protein [Archaeoglobales archaeon]|nr:DsbA family protein [Archaeoglobales archaeon]